MSNTVLWVSVAGPIVTSIAAILVLCGDRLRSLLFRPRLLAQLASASGLSAPIYKERDHYAPEVTQARWYHVKVTNVSRGRWPVANDVRVYLLEVKKLKGPRYAPIWTGEAPLTLQHERAFNPRRVVGPAMTADLLVVTETPTLRFNVVAVPNGAELFYPYSAFLRMKVIANSIEVDSPPLYLQAHWDGHWGDTESEMREHLILSEITADQYSNDDFQPGPPVERAGRGH